MNDDEITKIKLLLMFPAILIIGYFPLIISLFCLRFGYDLRTPIYGQISLLLACSNGCLNAIIYGYFSFRRVNKETIIHESEKNSSRESYILDQYA